MRLSKFVWRGSFQRLILALIFVLSVSWNFNWYEHPLSARGRQTELEDGYVNVKTEVEDGYTMVKKPLLQLRINGRMGNAIIEWATAMSIAKRNDMDVCTISPGLVHPLVTYFEGSFPVCNDYSFGYSWDENSNVHSWELTRDPSDTRNVRLTGYFNNATEWNSVHDEMVEQFAIKRKYVDEATEFIQNKDGDDYITVGIHARYGDKGRDGWTTADRDYYVAAMEAAEKTIRANDIGKDIRFLVATEPADVEWWDSLDLPLASKVIHIGLDAISDFAVLTLCDHLIVSEGTFSFMAAWYAENGLTRKKENDGKRIILHDPKYWFPHIYGVPFPMSSWAQVSDVVAKSSE